jgi:hypothetical protein
MQRSVSGVGNSESQESTMHTFSTPGPVSVVLDVHATTDHGDIAARSL